MADTAGFELAGDLVLRAKKAGYDIEAAQIARWNRAGLLPGLHQHGLGQGNGSDVRYPFGTGDQLMALCWIHKQFRKLEAVGWYLWLNGFQVERKYWILPLRSAANYFSENRTLLRTKLIDSRYQIFSLRPAGGKMLRLLPDFPLEHGQMRRLRRRVGKGQIGEFGRILLAIWAGLYRADGEANEQDRKAQRAIILNGFGLSRAWLDQTADGYTLLTGPIEPDLEKFSMQLARVTKARMLKTIQSDALTSARDELKLLLLGLTSAYNNAKHVHGNHAFGLGVIADFATITDIKLQALMILLFELTARSDPKNQLREILAVIKSKMVGDGRIALPPNH